MTDMESVDSNLKITGAASARLIRQHWSCRECVGELGQPVRAGRCQTCHPPLRPRPMRAMDSELDAAPSTARRSGCTRLERSAR